MDNKENKPKYLEELATFQYADVGRRLYANKADAQFAPSALEKLVDSFKVDKRLLGGLLAGTMASKRGIQNAILTYAEEYQKILGSIDISEFYDVRYNILKSLLGDEKANKAKATFEKYKGQTVGSIKKKVVQAQAISKDQTGLFDEKKKDEAKKNT